MAVQGDGKSKAAMLPALQMVSAWAAALQGAGDLGLAAEMVMGLLPVRDLRLVRMNRATGEVKRIHASVGAPARDVLDLARDDRFSQGQVVRGQDVTTRVVVLCHTANQCDLLVLRLFHPLSAAQDRLLQELAVALTESWANRIPFLVATRIVELSRRHGPRHTAGTAVAILDYSNPYALSRAEFRVCAMIGQGMAARQIARELRLSEATVRSHQRAIYAKTDLAGQMAVMRHLQAHPTAQSLLSGLQRHAA